MIDSWIKAAEAIGVSERGLRGLRKMDGWPGPTGSLKKKGMNRATVNRIKKWRANSVGQDRAADSRGVTPASESVENPANPEEGEIAGQNLGQTLKRIQILLNREKMLTTKLHREIKEGNHVRVELLDTSLGGLTAVFIGIIEEMEHTWPSRFANRNAGQLSKEMRIVLDGYRKRLIEKGTFELMAMEDVIKQQREGRSHVGKGRPTAGGR